MADVTVTFTADEAEFVLNELHLAKHGHGSADDFEPECPSCTAAEKLEAALDAGVPPQQPDSSNSNSREPTHAKTAQENDRG